MSRDKRLTVPVTFEEFEDIQQRAKNFSMSTQNYMRYAALSDKIERPSWDNYKAREGSRGRRYPF